MRTTLRFANTLPAAWLVLLLAAWLPGCGEGTAGAESGAESVAGRPVRAAVATLHPTEGSAAHGVVRFRAGDDGVRVAARVEGLEPGLHAYHVHVWGDCSAADGTSAGTHFNFDGPSLDPPEDIDRITGNLGNLRADAEGRAEHSARVARAQLEGPRSILGRAVVVHDKANDPASPPIGAAGGRVACGVIGIAAPESGDTP